jgi:hypothetical protein
LTNIDYFSLPKAHNELGNPLSKGALLEKEWCAGAIDDKKLDQDLPVRHGTKYPAGRWTVNDRSADAFYFPMMRAAS